MLASEEVEKCVDHCRLQEAPVDFIGSLTTSLSSIRTTTVEALPVGVAEGYGFTSLIVTIICVVIV